MSPYPTVEEVEAGTDIRGNVPGWGFELWSDLLDDEAPHRDFLSRLVSTHPEITLDLPEWERDEDYVEGALSWEGHQVSVYYETICSHLWLWSSDRKAVESLKALIALH